MDAVFDICYLSSDGNNVEPDDIPQTKESVWVLGKKYSAIQGKVKFDSCLFKQETYFFMQIIIYRFGSD